MLALVHRLGHRSATRESAEAARQVAACALAAHSPRIDKYLEWSVVARESYVCPAAASDLSLGERQQPGTEQT